MAGVSRRYFVAGAAGAAMTPPLSAATEDSGPSPDPTALFVDDFGARADCPRHGSTATATDDSAAIEAALKACPDGGSIRFTPGKCYMVRRAVEVTGKSITLDARDAVIRCGDDSVWHVFKLGGDHQDRPVAAVTILGGIWDGNRGHQRYWPNQNADAVYTELGVEHPETHQGTPFYENSPVNGTIWHHGWLNGSAGDRVDVNGQGNDGLIRVQHAQRVRFIHCDARDYVRNGFVAWNCADNLFQDCNSTGQLPSTFFELKTLFGRGFEAAFIKVAGANADKRALQGEHAVSARVIGGRVTGGAMPFFMRIQGTKPISSGSYCQIDGFQAHGIARELWFEDCASVRISNSTIICHQAHQSRFRNDPAIFFSNRTHDWVISNSYIAGRINTNQSQDRRFGVLESTILDCPAALDTWAVQCDRISNSILRCGGWGAVCAMASNSEFYAEQNAGLQATGTVRGCRIGALRYAGQTDRFTLSEGQNAIELPTTPVGLNHLRIRNPDVMGGRWFEIHKANFQLDGATLQLRNSDGNFVPRAGDEIEVASYGADAVLLPYAGLRVVGSSSAGADIDAVVENTRQTRIAGTCRITGQFLSIQANMVFALDDGASVDLSDVTVRRCSGGIVAAKQKATVQRLIIRSCWFEDWGLWGKDLKPDFRRPICRLSVTDLLQVTQSTFLRTPPDRGPRGQTAPSTNRGSVALLIEGDNVYAGGVTPARFQAERALRKPDFTE